MWHIALAAAAFAPQPLLAPAARCGVRCGAMPRCAADAESSVMQQLSDAFWSSKKAQLEVRRRTHTWTLQPAASQAR